MHHIMPIAFAGQGGGGYVIDGSALFDGSTEYLTWTPGSAATSQYKKTIHILCKRGALSTVQWLLDAGSNNDQVQFEAGNSLECSIAATVDAYLKTSAVFRDLAWLDITLGYDTTQAVAADRATLEINGAVVTAFSTATYPSLNHVLDFAENGVQQNIGRRGNNSQWFSGYIARFAIIDGQKLDSSSFGAITSDGYWQINNISGLTFGANGFLLEGQDVAAGTDSSGNGNDFTPGGTITATNDSPTNDVENGYGNQATIDPLLSGNSGTCTVSEGNTRLVNSSSTNNTLALTLGAPNSSPELFYIEFPIGAVGTDNIYAGFATPDWPYWGTSTQLGNVATGSVGIRPSNPGSNLQVFVDNNGSSTGTTVASGDRFVGAVEPSTGKVWLGLYDTSAGNTKWMDSGGTERTTDEPALRTNALKTFSSESLILPGVSARTIGGSGNIAIAIHPDDWVGTPPSGAVSLATQNLPAPDVPNPGTEYYQGKFTTESSGSTTVTIPSDLTLTDGFMVRIKRISGATQDWYYCDTVNGAGKHFPMDATSPTQGRITDANLFVSTSGQDIVFGTSLTASTEYLIEVFKIGDYFSVNNVTMTAGPTGTYNPGLGVAPGFIVGLQQSAATNQAYLYHRSLGKNAYLSLNNTNTVTTLSNAWGLTAPSASSVTVNVLFDNATTVTFYNWGQGGPYYFGTQEGNASANGPMATVNGFPQATFIKPVDTAENWTAHFSAIDTYNPRNTELNLRSDAVAGGSGTDDLDFVSNGLKVRGANTSINPSSTVVYGLFGLRPIQGPGDVNQGRAR
jgi:hypothetical protein